MVNHEWNIDSPGWHNVVGQLLELQLLLVLYWGGILKDGKAGAAYVLLLKKHREKHNSKKKNLECLLLNLIILNKKIYS